MMITRRQAVLPLFGIMIVTTSCGSNSQNLRDVQGTISVVAELAQDPSLNQSSPQSRAASPRPQWIIEKLWMKECVDEDANVLQMSGNSCNDVRCVKSEDKDIDGRSTKLKVHSFQIHSFVGKSTVYRVQMRLKSNTSTATQCRTALLIPCVTGLNAHSKHEPLEIQLSDIIVGGDWGAVVFKALEGEPDTGNRLTLHNLKGDQDLCTESGLTNGTVWLAMRFYWTSIQDKCPKKEDKECEESDTSK